MPQKVLSSLFDLKCTLWFDQLQSEEKVLALNDITGIPLCLPFQLFHSINHDEFCAPLSILFITRMPFSRRSMIEGLYDRSPNTYSLTQEWSWTYNGLDLEMTFTLVTIAILYIDHSKRIWCLTVRIAHFTKITLTLISWTWYTNLTKIDMVKMYHLQKIKFLGKCMQKFLLVQTDRQTHTHRQNRQCRTEYVGGNNFMNRILQ